MRTVFGIWIMCFAMVSLECLAQQNETLRLTIPLSRPGERGTLNLDMVNGSILVEGYGGREVIIDAAPKQTQFYTDECRSCDENESKTNGMKRISSNPIELEAIEENNSVNVESNSFKRALQVSIKVPSNFDLKLTTVNHGDIEVLNVNGTIEVQNVNGKIKLNNVSGSAIANTVNGDVTAYFKAIDDKAPMAFTTLNGNVDITLPSAAKATLKMKSERGEIFSDFEMSVRKSQPRSSRDGNSYRVEIDAWVYGDINDGGPEFMLKNMNGNIYIREK